MATRKSTFDWDRIELEYLAGEASVREIADRHEISEGAIRKRAKAEKWVRSVPTLRTVRTEPIAVSAAPTEPVQVPDAAVIAERGRGLVARMLDELDATTTHQGKLEEMIEDETSDDREARRRENAEGTGDGVQDDQRSLGSAGQESCPAGEGRPDRQSVSGCRAAYAEVGQLACPPGQRPAPTGRSAFGGAAR
jgi:hypothetical protein